MTTLDERVAALEARVAELAAALAETTAVAGTTAPAPNSAPGPAVPRPDPTPDTTAEPTQGVAAAPALGAAADPAGGVLYTGVVEPVPGERYEWQYGATTAGLLAGTEWSAAAATLAALAHPVRLLLLREVLGGRRTAADLSEVAGLGTSGQLYHHLRQLAAAGWLRSAGRGRYAVPPERVVPLLVILTAARH